MKLIFKIKKLTMKFLAIALKPDCRVVNNLSLRMRE